MDRRQALRALAVGSVSAAGVPAWIRALESVALARTRPQIAASPAAPAAPEADWTPAVLTAHQNDTVIALTELIIPQTDTAGATAALVNRFVDVVLADAERAERDRFLDGLAWIDARARELFGADFVRAAPDQQVALLTILSSPANRTLADRAGVEFFQAIKTLTVTGYYTSEVGMREELDDDGSVLFGDDPGCLHPEHKG